MKADLASTEHDVPIPQNAKVLAAVELLSGRLRDYVQESLARGAKYLPMIQNVFRAEGLPLDLAYIPVIESGFKTNALSKASAKGPWQFMKPTAKDHGLKTDWYIDERSDPEKATVAAAKYLKTLHRMFDGDWHLVLAAYNGGLGRLQRAMKSTGATTSGRWRDRPATCPAKPANTSRSSSPPSSSPRTPASTDSSTRQSDAVAYEKVAVPRAVDLRRVAEWTGHDDRRDPGAEPRAAALDHAGQVSRLRGQGPDRDGRQALGPPHQCAGLRSRRAELVHRQARRDAWRPSHASCGSRASISRKRTTSASGRRFAPGRT